MRSRHGSRVMVVGSIGMLLAFSMAGAGVAAPAPQPAADDGWPATPAGKVAQGWVEAFSSGEKAMKAFLAAHLEPKSLAERPMSARIVSYRKLRERYGALELAAVQKSSPAELETRLMAADASLHTFVFKVRAEPPHRLVSVGIVQRGHHGGGHSPH